MLVNPDVEATSLRLAIEELARYDAPIQNLPRTTTTDVMLHGVLIPRGSSVRLLLGSANRDERRYLDPDRFDIARPPAWNVAFGSGLHFCIGAPLARLEIGIGLPMLLRAFPEYRVVTPVERPRGSDVMRALLSLEIATTSE